MHSCSAVINRYGFNSKGVDAVRANLLSYRRGLLQRPVNKPGGLPGLVGVNLGAAQALPSLHPSQIEAATAGSPSGRISGEASKHRKRRLVQKQITACLLPSQQARTLEELRHEMRASLHIERMRHEMRAGYHNAQARTRRARTQVQTTAWA